MALEAPEQAMARAHPVWLAEVVSNLLDNALRYGGSNIEVKVRAEPSSATIEVCDNGPGIPPEQRELIFEPFWRGDRADLRGHEGTGLGLAIVREVVVGMGGRIAVRSRPDVDGTCFVVELTA